MWTTTTLKSFQPFSMGFDDFISYVEDFNHSGVDESFPKYNLFKTSDTGYMIEIALAGYSKKDITLEHKNGTVSVSYKKPANKEDEKSAKSYIHRGISKRSFVRTFAVANNIVVKSATFVDGLLRISLEEIIPEEKKATSIPIE